jgi:alpha-dioxygenase
LLRYGLLGKRIKDTFGHIGGPRLGGLVGLKKPDNHGVPYSLTEEFTSVYRMHSLIPSTLKLRDPTGKPDTNGSPPYLEESVFSNFRISIRHPYQTRLYIVHFFLNAHKLD